MTKEDKKANAINVVRHFATDAEQKAYMLGVSDGIDNLAERLKKHFTELNVAEEKSYNNIKNQLEGARSITGEIKDDMIPIKSKKYKG